MNRPPLTVICAALLLGSLSACPSPACDDCFSIELAQADASWAACCDYTRGNAEDPLLLRLTLLEGAEYTAGLAFGCAWDADSPPFEPALVTRDGSEVDGWNGFGVDFAEAGDQAVISVDCDPARPPPAWPLVLVSLLDPDLAAQFDPDAPEGDARLVITPEIDEL